MAEFLKVNGTWLNMESVDYIEDGSADAAEPFLTVHFKGGSTKQLQDDDAKALLAFLKKHRVKG